MLSDEKTYGTMIAVEIDGGAGPASALRATTVPIPTPKDGEVLIEVWGIGVNRPDIMQRAGHYPPPPGASGTLGLEVSGRIVVPSGRWRAGDQVCALLGGGGYAEYAVCDARHVLPVPKGVSSVHAASLPETAFTVYANVIDAGRLKPGETFLVHGANSGIGVMAIQMAKALGARVIATARGEAKVEQARAIGADIAINTLTEDFATIVKRDGGADLVLEMMGGSYFAKDLDAARFGGRVVFIGAQAGGELVLPILPVLQKQLTITGSTLRGRSAEEKARLAQAVERTVWPWIESGRIRPIVDAEYSLGNAADAHQRMEQGTHVGKIILRTAHQMA